MPTRHFAMTSTAPSIDGDGCLWREFNETTRLYEQRTCSLPVGQHPVRCQWLARCRNVATHWTEAVPGLMGRRLQACNDCQPA